MYTDTFRMFAAYNAWANERIYAAAGTLSPEMFVADRGLFFGSLMGTFNHLLVADRIWQRRFTGSGEAPGRLDAILFSEFGPLLAARTAEDARIIAYIAGLREADYLSTFTYARTSDAATFTRTLAPTLFHFFNHQTHHRGQCHAALTGLGQDAPSLDMVAFQRE